MTGVDDIGSLLVVWDNGSHLNVIHGVDEVQKLNKRREIINNYSQNPLLFCAFRVIYTHAKEHTNLAKG